MKRILLSLTVGSIALAIVGQERAIAGNYSPKEIVKKIATSTSASVLLPSEESFKKYFFSNDESVFAKTVTANQYQEYSINFSPISDCNANACMRFSVSARRGKEINTQIAQGRDASSEYIELVDGSKALASKHCGASCWGVVQWKYQNILYEVWTKARDAEGAISIANSMVKAGDLSKSSSMAEPVKPITPIASATTSGTWVNKQCEKTAPPTPRSYGSFEIAYQFSFISQRKSYIMYAARSIDGSYLFCTSLPGYRSPQLINHEKLNFPFIDQITQQRENSPTFDVVIRDGNGIKPKTIPFQLNLANPQKPAIIQPIAQPTEPIKPITPIAAANTYAYPSPDEFKQFKKTLKPSPITLSAADRQARTNFQTEWKQKNPAISSYVGAWKTADNQDVYVFPSKVAGRSNKSEPLSAFYGAIGSPELSPGTQEELDRAQCVSALPKGVAIVQTSQKPTILSVRVTNTEGKPPVKGDVLRITFSVRNHNKVDTLNLMPTLSNRSFGDSPIPLGNIDIKLNANETKNVVIDIGPFIDDKNNGKIYAIGSGSYVIPNVKLTSIKGSSSETNFTGRDFNVEISNVVLTAVVYDGKYFDKIQYKESPETYMKESFTRPSEVFIPNTPDSDEGKYELFSGGFDEMMGVNQKFKLIPGFSLSSRRDDMCQQVTKYAGETLGLRNSWTTNGEVKTDPNNHGFDYLIGLSHESISNVACMGLGVQVNGVFDYDLSIDRAQLLVTHESGHLFGAPHCDPKLGYVMCSGELHEHYKNNGTHVWHKESRDKMRNLFR